MKTRIFTLFVLLLFLLTACGKADTAVANTNAPLETEIPESTGAEVPVDPTVPQNQGDSIDFRYLY